MPEDSMDCGKYRKYWTDFQYLSSVFGFFGIANTDFGSGILKYLVSVQFFGILTQD